MMLPIADVVPQADLTVPVTMVACVVLLVIGLLAGYWLTRRLSDDDPRVTSRRERRRGRKKSR